jgi:phosphoribosylaminoimidazole-succinocarboxamide synthase
MIEAVFETRVMGATQPKKGKVRDIYDLGDQYILIVTTDRLSAFDVVLPQPIPGKGEMLACVSNFWKRRVSDVVPNDLTDVPLEEVVKDAETRELLGGRAQVVKKLRPLPVEAIVRGYIIGSGWKDYQKSGSVCGIELPEGLKLAEQLPEVIFTPSTKADVGDHDENISVLTMVALLTNFLAREFPEKYQSRETAARAAEALTVQVQSASLLIYTECAAYARERGIIIADTKFEFGLDESGTLHLIDEVLTPDSSRFWPVEQYQVGVSPPSFDKQFVRDYLETLDWDKNPPGPELPDEIVRKTAEKYQEAERVLTGK